MLKYLFCNFDTKAKDDLTIEGYANLSMKDGKPFIDRGDDFIEPGAWDLSEFKENPVLMIIHTMGSSDLVSKLNIGMIDAIEVDEHGLRVKATLTKSKHPDMLHIKTLVKEGSLKSFSVGFETVESVQGEIEGKSVRIVKKAKLVEISVVPIPENQYSFFTTKCFNQKEFRQEFLTMKDVLTEPTVIDIEPLKSEVQTTNRLLKHLLLKFDNIKFLQPKPSNESQDTETETKKVKELESKVDQMLERLCK